MKDFLLFLKFPKGILMLLLALMISFCAEKSYAQSVNVTVSIVPPYSPYYSDYSGPNASKVLLIVQNLTSTAKSIKLTGQLEGDNGIKISTKSNYVPLQPIVLNPNETKQLNGLALKDIFDLNTLNVYGIDKSRLIYTSRLPEGNYSFCIQAVDVNSNQLLSSAAPLGCTTISIAYPDAPVPINPSANYSVTSTMPQSVVFNWINPGFTPVGTQYLLQVAEMPFTNADPNQILNSTTYPLVNKTINSTSYVLSPSDPPLKVGRRYAWRVKAIDPTGKIIFKNNGTSQAYQFRYGAEVNVASILTLDSPKNNIKIEDLNGLNFKWQFKDNSAGNDPVSLSGINGLSGMSNLSFNTSMFRLHIIKVKDEDKKVSVAFTKLSATPAENIVVNVNAKTISYKNSAAIMAFVKDKNNYEWYVEHPATGTKSETRYFTVQYPKQLVDYTIALAGRLKYRYYNDLGAYQLKTIQRYSNPNLNYTEAEGGYTLSKINIQALRVKMLVPVYRVKRSVKVVENGQPKIYSEEVDSIPTLNDLRKTYSSQIKLASVTPIISGQTDSMGNFELKVPISKNFFKVIDSNVTSPGSNVRKALVEGIVVQVNDQRFSDPNWFIFPTPDKMSVALNEDVVQIYDYKLNVSFTTKVQRDYKGKMYLLRVNKDLVRGEVDNLYGQSKDILNISPSAYLYNGKPSYAYTHTNYSVVGVRNIPNVSNPNQPFTTSFEKLISNKTGSNNNYIVYFEPDGEQDALYFSPELVSNSNLKTVAFENTVFTKRNITEEVSFGPKYLSMKISGRYLYKWKEAYGKTNAPLPLPEGTKLILVKGYVSSKSFLEDKGSEIKEQNKVATATVGKNGAYNFNLGLLDYNAFNEDAGKSLLIIIDDNYYASEPQSITYNQNEDVKIPDLVAVVRQFKFASRLLYKSPQGTMLPANQMDIYLCRKKGLKPLTIPVNEGDPEHKNYFKTVFKNPYDGKEYDIIDKTTPTENGSFSFERMALPSKDLKDEYFILAEPQSNSNDNYNTDEAFPLSGILRFASIITLGSFGQQTFTDATQVIDYKYNKDGQFVRVVPQVPYIDGAVYPYSNTATSVLSGVQVELFDFVNTEISATADYDKLESYFKNKKAIDTVITGTNGRFLFNEFYKSPSKYRGKMLRLSKLGFITTYKVIEGGVPLIKGHRANLQKVYMDLPLTLDAYVADIAGNRVPARIIVGNDFSWTDSYQVGPTEMVTMKTPRGIFKVTVIPSNKAKYKTTVITLNEKTSRNIGKLEVNTNTHTIAVTVLSATTKANVPATISVTNIKETPGLEKFNANGKTINELTFASAGNQFDLRVVPTGNYTIAKTQVKSDMSKTVAVTVYVEPAITLTCTATEKIGKFKVNVPDYNISIDELDDDEYVITKRNDKSSLEISKVPASKWITVGASKAGYIGQRSQVFTNSAKTLSFNFTKLGDMPDKLYGFPVELTSAGKLSGDNYLISGRLNPAGTESLTALKPKDAKAWLRFSDVKIKIETSAFKGFGDTKKVVKILSDVVFEENELNAMLYGKVEASIRNENGLRIESNASKGSIVGKVAIDPASFSAGVYSNVANNSGEGNYLYLNPNGTTYVDGGVVFFPGAGSSALNLKTLTTDVSDVTTADMLVSTLSRKRPSFNIVDNFTVKPVEDVLLNSAGISAKSTVNTSFAYVKTPGTQLKGTFNIGYSSFSFTNKEALKISLRDWQLEFSDWYLTAGGFVGQGNLNALGLSIPFTRLKATQSAIGFGKFEVKQLTLLNKFPVSINANEVMTSFGYDKGYSPEKGAWSVAILANSQSESLASLMGLPDLGKFDQILINNINLYDTGNPKDTRILLTENQPAVSLNGISSYRPYSVFGGLDFISFRGSLDLNIPNLTGLGNVTYDLKYKVVNDKFVHVHDVKFENLVLDANGVKVKFDDLEKQEFSNGKLKLFGKLTDKDPSSKYAIDVQLDKSASLTRLHMLEGTPQPQRVYLSGDKNSPSYLDNAVGEMKVTSKVWDNFTFSGDMTGNDGVNASDSRLTFIAKGDLVANSSKVGVQNMDAGGMTGINFTYDFKEKAIVGSASFAQKTSFADLTMDIDMKISPSSWYVFSNCVANNIKNTPFNQAAAGIMLGNSTVTASQLQSLHKHFKDNDIPENFDNYFSSVKGILMVMSTDIPIPIIPQFDIKALEPVAHASLTHGIYGNLYFNAKFSLKPEDISMAVGARLGAFVKLSVGASIGLACAGINLHADVHADVDGKLAPFAPPGNRFLLHAGIKFTLEGSAYVGAGICNSSCETPCIDAGFFDICSPIPCFKKDLTKKLVLGLDANVTDASPYFHLNSFSAL